MFFLSFFAAIMLPNFLVNQNIHCYQQAYSRPTYS